jgi:integrase
MRKRTQNGQIIPIGNRWYLRYWQRQNVGGKIERKRCTQPLGAKTTTKPPKDIQNEAANIMREVNSSVIPIAQLVSLGDFIENVYLPWVKENKKASTYKGYNIAWQYHLKLISTCERAMLKKVRTYDVQSWLDTVERQATVNLAKNTLKRIKSFLSGAFKTAKRLGYFDGINPVQDTEVSRHAPGPRQTYAYSLEEISNTLTILPEPAATAFAVAAYAGLRAGEIEALEWCDYHDGALHINRSIWNGTVVTPKTTGSCAPVPVIRPLAERLEIHRLRCGNPQSGPIFTNSLCKRLCFNNLLKRTILPTLNRCHFCGLSEGKPHLGQDHEYKRDDRIPEWHGWHAARPGLGSNLYRLGVHDKVIQQILRHSNVAVTLSYYIKSSADDALDAMERLEQKISVQSLRDSDRTLNAGSGAMPASVN